MAAAGFLVGVLVQFDRVISTTTMMAAAGPRDAQQFRCVADRFWLCGSRILRNNSTTPRSCTCNLGNT
jgi:hypothetical protein